MRHGRLSGIILLAAMIPVHAPAVIAGGVPPHRLFPTQQIAADVLPTGLIAADLDKDGVTDLVIAGPLSGVRVRLGNGDGSFAAPQELLSAGRDAIACGDIDDDGRVDLVTADHANARLIPLIGIGDGTFVPATPIELGERAADILIVDVDEDTHPDLVTANPETGSVSIVISVGGGRFASPVTLAAGVEPVALAAGDVDGDGSIDIVVADAAGNAVLLLPGTAALTFATAELLGPAIGPRSIATGDVDGDGEPEVIVAHSGTNTVSVIDAGDTTPAFADGDTTIVGLLPSDVTLSDVDGDGRVDLVVTSMIDATIAILRGTADGQLSSPEFLRTIMLPSRVASAHLDADGHGDLVVLGSRGVVTHFGGADGVFPTSIQLETAGCANSIAITDADLDGRPEVLFPASVGAGAHAVRRVEAYEAGVFSPTTDFAVGDTPIAVRAANIDGDPGDDLAVLNLYTHDVSIFHALPGTYTLAQKVSLDRTPRSLATGDMNADGHDDLALAMADGSTTLVTNDGTGRYGAGTTIDFPSFYGLALADLDHDGAAEIIGTETRLLVVATSDGAGALTGLAGFPTELTSTHPVHLAAVEDVDGDGHHDAIVLQARDLAVMRGLGDGTFDLPVTHSLDCTPELVTVADVNGDTRLDIVAGCPDTRVMVVLLGTEEGTFGPPSSFHVSTSPASYGHGTWSLVASDLDRDGDADVLIGVCGDSTLLVLENATTTRHDPDIDASGEVGWSDLVVILETWGPCASGACNTDLTGDGVVGFSDLLWLLTVWPNAE